MYHDLYPKPDGPKSYGGVALTLATNPAYVFQTLLTSEKLRYFLQIMAPLAFLPLRRVFVLPAIVPGAMFTLLTTGYAPTTDIAFQYSGHYVPYVFAAAGVMLAAYGAERSGKANTSKSIADRATGVLSQGNIAPPLRAMWHDARGENHEIGSELAHELDQPHRVPGLADHFEPGTLEQSCETLAQEDLVVRQHDPRRARAHGNDYGVP